MSDATNRVAREARAYLHDKFRMFAAKDVSFILNDGRTIQLAKIGDKNAITIAEAHKKDELRVNLDIDLELER